MTSGRGPALAFVLVWGASGCADDGSEPATDATSTVGSGAASVGTTGVGGGDVVFTADELAMFETLSPPVLPPPPADVTNAYADDPAAAALGKAFFFDAGFSGALLTGDNDGSAGTLGVKGETGKVSCASCHLPDADFNDTRSPSKQISLAAAWGKRKAPSLLDVGQATIVTWDGRRDTLHNQVFAPIESAAEMNGSRLFTAHRIFDVYRDAYEAVFGPLPPLDDAVRFPPIAAADNGCTPAASVAQPEGCDGTWRGYPGDGAEYDGMTVADQEAVTRVVVNFGKAIAAYERKLACGQGRFDAFVAGDRAALTASEQRGAKVFVGEGKCVSCHSGPYFSDQAFHNVGLRPAQVAAAFYDLDDAGASEGLSGALADPLNAAGPFSDGDDGRLPASVPSSMLGAFRTPTLRCVARRPSFMHTAQLRTLASVVDFFDQGGHPGGFLGTSELAPLHLTAEQKADLVAFLQTLDGPGADPSLLAP